MDRKKPKRPAPISIRLTQEEADEVCERVRNARLSRSAYFKACVFGKAPPRSVRTVPLEAQAAATLLAQSASINDKLKKLIEQADDLPRLTVLEQCRDLLAEILACLLAVMGKRP